MDCKTVTFTRHAIERMFERAIAPKDVVELIVQGTIIADYPDDKPYPGVLLLGFVGNRPVHMVVARNQSTGECYVVTVYIPDPQIWGTDFKTRRKP
ncbi:MAG: DUF4258 domain-containing protein [Calditrichaeota bacterium]|nr:MAG: DUF4258 domain-containing protein [Calditrichota bacterium]